MKDLNVDAVNDLLDRIIQFELAGVVRYTHYSLMVTGPSRLPIVEFLKLQATESLQHAQAAGEIITGLNGHPSMQIAPLTESNDHSVGAILEESHAHETRAIDMYRELLELVDGKSVYLEDYARGMMGAEEAGAMEFAKMMRDFG